MGGERTDNKGAQGTLWGDGNVLYRGTFVDIH